MRSGKALLAVALTISTSAVGFGGMQEGSGTRTAGFQFRTPDPVRPTSPTASNRRTATRTIPPTADAARPMREVATPLLEQTRLPVIRDSQVIPVSAADQTTAAPQQDLTDFGPLDATPAGVFQPPTVLPGAGTPAASPMPARNAATPVTPATPAASQAVFGSEPAGDLFGPAPGSQSALEPAPAPPTPATPSAAAPTDARRRTLHQPRTETRSIARPGANSEPMTQQGRPGGKSLSRGVPVRTVSRSTIRAVTGRTSGSLSPAETVGKAPAVAVSTVRAGEWSVGQRCDCSLVIRNTGSATAGNVILEAYVPENLQVVETNPATSEQGALVWTMGELQPGEEKTVELRAIPTAAGDMEIKTFVRFSGQTAAAFQVVEPKLKVALAGPAEANLGDAAPFVITVSNPGSGTARNVVVSATVPAGLEHRRGQQLSMQIGDLNAGESRNVRLALTAVEAGKHALQVEATAEADLRDASTGAVAVLAPQLGLQIAGPPIRHAGRRGTYTVVVSNPGNVAASNVRARYRIPEGFDFIQADRGGRLLDDRSIEWFVGQLAPGETSKFNVMLKARTLGDCVHQAAAVSEAGVSESAELASRIEGVASLALTIQDRDDPVEVGQETLYEVRVANEGSKAAGNVLLACELPAGMQIKSVVGPVDYRMQDGQLVFEPLKSLNPGAVAEFQLIVTATAGGSQRLRARVTSDATREPLSSEELTKVYAD